MRSTVILASCCVSLLLATATAQAETTASPTQSQPADLLQLKKDRAAELEKRLQSDTTLAATDRERLQVLVSRLRAEIAAADTATAQR